MYSVIIMTFSSHMKTFLFSALKVLLGIRRSNRIPCFVPLSLAVNCSYRMLSVSVCRVLQFRLVVSKIALNKQ